MTFNRLTDSRYGQMLYNRFDEYVGASIAEYGEFSPGEGRLFAQIITPDMLVIEVGANMGALTLCLAKHARHVIALEPQQHPFYLLCANVALNSVTNVTCINNAMGGIRKVMYFPNTDPGRACNFGGGQPVSAPTDSTYPVRCGTLDDYETTRVDFIKIDVEGQEADVIWGGATLIRRSRPVMYVENDRPENSESLEGLIRNTGYRMFWHKPPLYEPGNWKGSTVDLWPGIGSFNMLCIPKERGIAPPGMVEIV